MTERVLGPTGSPRRRKTLLLPAIVVLAAAVAFGVTAATGASLPGSNFEIDADANLVVDSGEIDWASVTEVRRTDLPTGSGDDSYQGGVKEDTACPGTTTGSIPNNKSDLLDFGSYFEPEAGGPGWLHVFWRRVQEPNGTTNMDFEFNKSTTDCDGAGESKNVTRTVGDILLQFDVEQGGAVATLSKRTWGGTAWSDPAVPLGATEAIGDINDTAISSVNSDGLGAMSERTFGEASFDLSQVFDPNKCESFGSVMLKSRSSDSFTSQLKDFIAPQPVNITNCGTVIIRKQTNPDENPNATEFDYTKSFGTDPSSGNTFKLKDDDVKSFTGVLFGSGYTVTEGTVPTGWEFVSVDCSASAGVTPSINGATVTFAIDNAADVLDCTYTNRALGNIKLVKNTAGGDDTFTFAHSIAGLATSLTTSGGTANSTSSAITAGSAYAITENAPPTGWDFTSAECKLADTTTSTGTVSGRSISGITVEAGKTTTCTFTNTKRGDIKLVKNTVGGDGTFAFTHSISGLLSSLTTTSGTANDTSDAIAPGTSYAISENVPPTGWDFTSASCKLASGSDTGTVSGSSVTGITVEAGKTTTCTFTNTKRARVNILKLDDQSPPAALNGAVFTLYTDVSNAPGSPVGASIADPNSCTTAGIGTDAGKCSILNVLPGTYWVVETTTPTGYATAPAQKVTLSAGGTVSLTFTDPRLHKMIVIVCHEATNTLAQSSVTVGGTTKNSLSSAPSGLTQAQLCGLNGSSFGGLGHAKTNAEVDVGSGAH